MAKLAYRSGTRCQHGGIYLSLCRHAHVKVFEEGATFPKCRKCHRKQHHHAVRWKLITPWSNPFKG